MRRRNRSAALVEPPARLVAYDPAQWLPLVVDAEYDPEQYRNRSDGVGYGPPRRSLEDWRHQRAQALWSAARLAWHAQHGWPGGITSVDLLRQSVHVRRAANGHRS